MNILLDTAEGGYCCFWCGLPLAPDEHQLVTGSREGLFVTCDDCLTLAGIMPLEKS